MRTVFILSLCLFGSVALAATKNTKSSKMKYPETRRVDQVDEYFGVKVPDPYRWLEADVRESPEVAEWVKKQNEVARQYLGRDSAAARNREAAHGAVELRALFAARARRRQVFLYEERRPAEPVGAVRGRLVQAEGRVLVDPNKWSEDGTIAMSTFQPERRRPLCWRYARSEAGSDWQQIYVLDVETGKELDEPIEVGSLHADRLGEGRQRVLLQPLSRAAAGRVHQSVGAQPDDLLPQAWHEAGGRQAGLPPARSSRLELLVSRRPTTANTWCFDIARSTDPQNQVLVREASAAGRRTVQRTHRRLREPVLVHRQRRHEVLLSHRSRRADQAHRDDGHRAAGPRAC